MDDQGTEQTGTQSPPNLELPVEVEHSVGITGEAHPPSRPDDNLQRKSVRES